MGTSRLDAKGEIQVDKTTRVRVLMQGTGAEQLVVVEVSVMEMERRGCVRSSGLVCN